MRPTVGIALGAVIGALAVAAVPATADVNPQPLWRAYPLHSDARAAGPSTKGQAAETAVARPAGRRAAARRAPPAVADGGPSPLQAVAIGVLSGVGLALAWVLVVVARGPLSRRLEGARGVRELPTRVTATPVTATPVTAPRSEPVAMLTAPPAEPEECEIVWWTRGLDSQFRAVGRNRAGRRYVAARSVVVGDPRPPLRQGETLEAWEALVQHLQKRGWTPQEPAPNGNGTPWYAQRFQRQRRPARPNAPATGERA